MQVYEAYSSGSGLAEVHNTSTAAGEGPRESLHQVLLHCKSSGSHIVGQGLHAAMLQFWNVWHAVPTI